MATVVAEPTLRSLVEQLNTAMERNEVRPENADARVKLLHPIEQAVRRLPHIEPEPAQTAADKITRLLWFKHHPQELDTSLVLQHLRDPNALVRSIAADLLHSVLETDASAWMSAQTNRAARQIVAEQTTIETSPLVRLQLDRLSERLPVTWRARQAPESRHVANPYIVGAVIDQPDRFFGRQQTVRDIRKALGAGTGSKGVVLYGARRTGKTSLLYRIRDGALGDDFVAAYLDMQSLAGRKVEELACALMHSIDDAVRRVRPDAVPESAACAENGLSSLDALHECINTALDRIAPASLIVLFDEYELLRDFVRDIDATRRLESFRERTPRLAFLFAGSQKVESLQEKNFTVLLDNCAYIKMTYLQPDECRELIVKPARGVLTYGENIVTEILDLSGGHPLYAQILCHSLFDLAASQGQVTEEHLQQAVKEFVDNPAPHLILGWNALALEQKVALSAVAEIEGGDGRWVRAADITEHLRRIGYPIRVTISELQQVLGNLRELDWLNKKQADRSFRVSLGLVQCWIAEHRAPWDVLEQHRSEVLTRTAGFGRRMLAAGLDFALACALVALWIAEKFSSAWLPAIMVAAYHLLTIPTLGATLFMMVCRIRIVSETGVRPSLGSAVAFAMLRGLPFSSLFAVIPLLEQGMGYTAGIVFALTVLISVVHAGRIWLSKTARGLFDVIARVAVVRSGPRSSS